ncbi:thioredoxin family protein [Chitinimonas sp. BJYL2]|uniref:thioredoxin family protein n=1 Tax=Chitinimonas sp. BJYL2 TaxID=2976696 RepID=UPI0022B37F0E|nr:thioredoxin family protein [Chitinimonas sp. BJYL2]
MRFALILTALLTASAVQPAIAKSVSHALPPGIAWEQGDVTAAFARAKATQKPLFLYWGAVWCPPCNQVKATIFKQQAFIERTRQFIPVYLDGDSPGAQKLASQYKVRGYPTMILFKPDGSEITRLPGEVDLERYLQTLELGLSNARPVRQLLASANQGEALSHSEWQLLADYAWETDRAQLVPEDRLPGTLANLVARMPANLGPVALRLKLKALAVSTSAGSITPEQAAQGRSLLHSLFATTGQTRRNFDVLVNYTSSMGKVLTAAAPAERETLLKAWHAALRTLADDTTVSTTDRLAAAVAGLSLARISAPEAPLPTALVADIRQRVSQADQTTTDGYERQSVISLGADALTEAGLDQESDRLLLAELKRSHSPYYFMLGLAANAKARGDKAAALNWMEQAYQRAEGPATRLQWGVSYISGLIELSPQDAKRIDKATLQVLKELEASKHVFYERNQRALEKLLSKLTAWNKDKAHQASLRQVHSQLDKLCRPIAKTDPQKPVCEGLVKQARG